MIVPYVDHEDAEAVRALDPGLYHSGCIGSEVECERDAKPRKPIGFRMPEPEPVICDPSWMLI